MNRYYKKDYYTWLLSCFNDSLRTTMKTVGKDIQEDIIRKKQQQGLDPLNDEKLFEEVLEEADSKFLGRVWKIMSKDEQLAQIFNTMAKDWNENWNEKAGYKSEIVTDEKMLFDRTLALSEEDRAEWNINYNQYHTEILLREIEIITDINPVVSSVEELFDIVNSFIEYRGGEYHDSDDEYLSTKDPVSWVQESGRYEE